MSGSWTIAAAAGVRKLNGEIVQMLGKPESKARFAHAGSEVIAGTPAQPAAVMKADSATMGGLVQRLNIRVS